MATPPSQKDLLKIEESQAESATFIEAAASFLRLELRLLASGTNVVTPDQNLRKSLAPREEFVLKLLLRRLPKSDDIFTGDYWVLLAHLVSIIPVRALAHLLGDRNFFVSLNEALERLLALKSNEGENAQHDTFSDEDSGRPTKKQKLRKGGISTSARSAENYSRICKAINSLVQLSTGGTEIDELSRNAIRSVLSASPEVAATVTGNLLQLIQRSLSLKMYESEWDQLTQKIPTVLLIWTYRKADAASEKSPDQCFASQCLRPALQLLAELEDHKDLIDTPPYADAMKALERLVALHSVLPLRSLFLAEKGQQWKAKIQAITWHDFKDLQANLRIMLLGPNLSEVDAIPESSFMSILQYYSIAVRAVPRPTVRRAQEEQPWLDSLFCIFASLSNEAFPRMELDGTGHLIMDPSLGPQKSKILSPNLSKLLTLAAERAVKLSLSVLLYLTATTLEYQHNNEQWRVLARILEQDVNVLIPNSGLLETPYLLEKIMGLLSITSNEDAVDYQLVRDGIMRPLLSGFAHARDLKGFVALWMIGLQDVTQQRASGGLQYLQSHLIIVWEDELLFRGFEDATKALATSTLAQSLVTEMLELLEQAADRIGPTSDITSHVAIAASLLTARPNDIESSTLEGIITATISALSRRSDYQLQRWRLWRLLRQCLTLTENPASTGKQEQLQQSLEKLQLVSISTLSETLISTSSYTRDARLREALECFNIVVSRAAKSEDDGGSLLRTELGYLIALLTDPKTSKKKKSSGDCRKLDFGASCVAIILQHPQILQYPTSATTQLVAAMIGCLQPFWDTGDSSGLSSLIKALLSSEELSSRAELFNDCCSALLTSVDEHVGPSRSARDILIAVPLQGLKKPLAQKFADILVQRLRSDATIASSLDQILPDLGLLEILIATFNVSVGRPKRWVEHVDLAEHILSRLSPAGSNSQQSASACLFKMFKVLWRRCQNDAMPSDMSERLLAFQSRLRDVERPLCVPTNSGGQLQSEEQPQSLTKLDVFAMSSDVSMATAQDLEEIAFHINLQISSLGSRKSSELAMLADQEELNSRSFLLLSAIICQTSASEAAQDQSLLESMSKIVTLTFAQKARTAADLCLALETCKLMLEKHPLTINQHAIDTLLSSITALTSPSTMEITSNAPSAIFDRMCSLLGLLFSHHRKRLGGRYHIILPALEGLLKCLFFAGTSSTAPSQTKSQVVFIRGLPLWLRASKDPLPPKSAEHFTKLLTTICDPSVSSVRRKNSNALTDETKKAKSLAGQYMQYLIMDFCRCSLHGRIPSASKEKLVPGLYAVLDVMDRETMRGMNGAMDSNGRALWKGLYQDWERWGRWDKR